MADYNKQMLGIFFIFIKIIKSQIISANNNLWTIFVKILSPQNTDDLYLCMSIKWLNVINIDGGNRKDNIYLSATDP